MINNNLFQYLNHLAGQSICLDSLIIFSAQYLGYWLVAGLFAFLIFGKDKKREWKMIIFSALSIFLSRVVITELIRYFYYVPRPFVNNDVYQLIFHETNGSFPSGHAAIFFALATAIYLVSQGPSLRESKGRSFSAIFFIGAILIGVARIIAGVHWPIDILGGAIIGILSAFIINLIPLPRRQAGLPPSPPKGEGE